MAKKICIVDDSKFQRNSLKRLLIELGYEPIVHQKAVDVLEYFKNDEADCLITDLLMPEMDGMELIEKAKAQGVSAPIVVLSANIQTTVKAKCEELGAAHFLNKPTDKEQLAEVLKGLFEGGRKDAKSA